MIGTKKSNPRPLALRVPRSLVRSIALFGVGGSVFSALFNMMSLSLLTLPLHAMQVPEYTALQHELQREFLKATKYEDVPNTLLLLKLIVDDAVRQGVQAPDYNLCKLHLHNTHLFCQGNKDIPRIDMPQLKGKPVPGSQADGLPRDKRGEVDVTNNFIKYLEEARHYAITLETVPAASLKATQNELVGSKVAGIWAAIQDPTSESYRSIMDEPLVISQDDYVLDGHHRWAAAVARAIEQGNLMGLQLKVKRVNVGIDQLVKDANQFTQEFGIKAERGLPFVA